MPAPAPLKAMILAAGRGERMRPLTDHTPKPLLPVAGRPMIEWHLQALAAAGVQEVVINTAWLEDQFPAALGDGSRWGLRIHYSAEGRDHGAALETAGGIAKALPWLGDCFWLVSGDIHAPGFTFPAGLGRRFAEGQDDAWLWLVPNPDFNATGDFALAGDRVLRPAPGQPRPWTYANLALLRRRLVAGLVPGQAAPLGPLLFASAAAGRLGGQALAGPWHNLGTPAQLAALAAPPAEPGARARPGGPGPVPGLATLLPAGLALLAALCAGLPDSARAAGLAGPVPAPARATAPAPAAAASAAASALALPSSRFTYQGLPPVLAGQALSEAESALGQPLRPELSGLPIQASGLAGASASAVPARPAGAAPRPQAPVRTCSYKVAASQPGLRYALAAGTVLRVETRDPRYRTVSGVRVGDSVARVERAYKGRLSSRPHPYFDQGRVFTVTSPDKRHALVLESNDQGRIVTLRSGRLPEVAWLEAC